MSNVFAELEVLKNLIFSKCCMSVYHNELTLEIIVLFTFSFGPYINLKVRKRAKIRNRGNQVSHLT